MNKQTFFALAFGLLLVGSSDAQITTPQPSPMAKLTQTVGLTDVTVEYSRPSARGRKVFGDLVPLGEIWRTGANAAVKLTFADSATIGGIKVQKGSYSLYTIPSEKMWTIIVNKNTNNWGTDGYEEKDDIVRFMATPQKTSDKQETMSFNFNNLKSSGGDLELVWENTKVVVPIGVFTDGKVSGDIKKKFAGPTFGEYHAAARYYLDEKKDLAQAKAWIDMAMEKGAAEKFWMVRTKALIQAETGDYKGAIATAKKSIELAKKEKNDDYVRNNEKSIEEWSKK